MLRWNPARKLSSAQKMAFLWVSFLHVLNDTVFYILYSELLTSFLEI